ncbi:MAG: hypothetical protein PVF05_11440 [Gemmatimonadales bacterium]
MRVLSALLLILTFPFAASTAKAQHADLVGSWMMSPADSDFGNTRAPEAVNLEIQRADTRLTMTSSRDFGAGPESVEIDIPIDGSRHTVATPRGSMLMSAEWDGDVLEVWRRAEANVGEVDVTERYNVEGAGKRMRVETSIEVPQAGTFESTIVFVRSDE